MKTSIYTISVAVIMMCAACKNDIDTNFDDMSGVLTINAFLYADHDTNFVYVSETALNNPLPIVDATVEMRINGNLVETVNKATPSIKCEIVIYEAYDSIPACNDTTYEEINNGAYLLTKRFSEGDVVRIDVYSKGRHAWAEETAPRKIQNPKADFKLANHIVADYDDDANITFADFTITLPDISPDPDYYRISVYADYDDKRTIWRNHGVFYTTDNIDSICSELRQKYENVVPIEFTDEDGSQKVSIYYLGLFDASYWNYGTEINFDYGSDPILSEGEMIKQDTEDKENYMESMVGGIKNKHKVFTDHFFNNSTAEIGISVRLPFGNIYTPEIITPYDFQRQLSDEYLLMAGYTYGMKVKLSVESISANQYYYLKALNVVQSKNYVDMVQMSGAMKIPSNVNGGSGNICITTNTVFEFTLLDNYETKRVIDHNSTIYSY